MEMIDIIQFPVSALLGVAFLLAIWALHRFAASNRVVKALAGWKAGAVVMSLVAAAMAVEGTWGINIHSHWSFFILVLVLQCCLELAVLEHCRIGRARSSFVATHLGMLIMAWASFWGAPDTLQARIAVNSEEEVSVAFDDRMMNVPLPFSLRLEEFVIDRYEGSQMPRQFTSRMSARDLTRDSQVSLVTSVNHPCRYKGYSIYQEGYDQVNGSYSIIRLTRDPWLPLVYLGMLLLMIGSAAMLAGKWQRKVLIPAVLVLAVIFAVASVSRISFGTLPPALRSLWFVPHLVVYMVAYSSMAVSVILALTSFFVKKGNLMDLSDRLLRTSSVLLLSGMLCGCVWAKQAWGDYWTWDPKECWAGVTWLLTLVYMHLAPLKKKSSALAVAVLLLSFLSIQVTWYGVNYLPSAHESLHTYNK